MGECNGMCERYDTCGFAGYTKGYKWCSRCRLFIKQESKMCECCKTQLRVRSWQHPKQVVKRIE